MFQDTKRMELFISVIVALKVITNMLLKGNSTEQSGYFGAFD